MTGAAALAKPLVSVVIPHFNRSGLLRTAVESVLASTEKSLEVIVVDDGSTETEAASARSLESDRVRVIARASGAKGPSRCRNLGVEASTADHIVFLDSDDFMAPWCLKQRLAAASAAPNADLWVFPAMLFTSTPGDSDRLWNRMDNGTAPELRFIRSDPPWHTSSPLWSKEAFKRIGGFNERIFYGDDSDLHMRAIIERLESRLYADEVPDVFVRRSSDTRITNSVGTDLRESRKARLTEGTKYLRKKPDRPELLSSWEGQYFAEAEFFLFNETEPSVSVGQTLEQWQSDFAPARRPPLAANTYFSIALRSKSEAYFLLRAARRAAMLALPKDYFPLAPALANLPVATDVLEEIRQRLRS